MGQSEGLGKVFRARVMAERIDGYRMAEVDPSHLRIEGETHFGEVNSYVLAGGTEVVEMRITRRADDQYVFFLHFMLEDLTRALELFDEMADVLRELSQARRLRVLLSCTCGITTTMFAARMAELSDALGLGYDVEAKALDRALGEPGTYDAVMLAPQVSHERSRVAQAYPDAAVFEIPARIFGSYDAAGAVRLLASAIDGRQHRQGTSPDQTGPSETIAWPGCIMVATAVLGGRQSTCEYRIFDDGQMVLRGTSAKRTFSFHDVEDLLAGVRLEGFDVGRLDAIGIAVPGIVDKDAVSLLTQGVRDYDLGGHVQDAYGVPVFLDNDANAAAVGCYAIQPYYQSITYHRESFGHAGGGQGMVVDGRLREGRLNFAGELNHLVGAMAFSADPQDLAWTEDGMYELVARWVLVNVVQFAPEAIYVDAWPVTDMRRLRRELVRFVDERYLPDLMTAPDFTESTLLGELALCVQRLRA